MEKFAKDEGMEIAANSRQPDFTEAVNAFIEKRMPVYNQKINQDIKKAPPAFAGGVFCYAAACFLATLINFSTHLISLL